MFGYDKYKTFEMFSLSHFFVILFVVACTAVLVIFRKKVIVGSRFDAIFKYAIVGTMIAAELWHWAWELIRTQDILAIIPFEMCAISLWLTCFGVLLKKKALNKIAFMWASTGSLLSVLFPDIAYGFPHMRFLHFFYVHIATWLLNFYFVLTGQITYRYRDIPKICGFLFLVGLMDLGINLVAGRNFMYLMQLPAPATAVSEALGIFFLPIWIVLIFSTFHLWYFLYKLFKKELKWTIRSKA